MTDIETDLDKPIAISLDDDDASKVEKTGKVAGSEKGPTPDEAIADLKSQIEAANAEKDRLASQRAEAERRAAESEQRATSAQEEIKSSEHQIIANALEVVERDIKMAKQNYAAAMASGNYEAVADAQEALSEAAAKRLQLSNAKIHLESQLPARMEGRVADQQPRQPQQQDPVEAWAQTLSPRSAKWVREHREAVTDPTKARKLTAAHNAAVDLEGIEPDSDAYFAYIEQRMGYRQAEESEPAPAAHLAPRQARTIAAAPSSSSSSGGQTRRSDNTVTLSPAERETARALGMTERDYAINKMALIREGKLSA